MRYNKGTRNDSFDNTTFPAMTTPLPWARYLLLVGSLLGLLGCNLFTQLPATPAADAVEPTQTAIVLMPDKTQDSQSTTAEDEQVAAATQAPTSLLPSPTATVAPATPSPTPASTVTVTATPVPPERIHILYTSDEHGYVGGRKSRPGAAALAGLWDEWQVPEGEVILRLSGGDSWSGASVATAYDGENAVAVMNRMDYDAMALGNHELDFGLLVLQMLAQQAHFPILSANVRFAADNSHPVDLGIQPYAILEREGLRIGIVGLTYLDTLHYYTPLYTGELVFIDYEVALREVVPQLQAEGAEVIIVLAHDCGRQLAHDCGRQLRELSEQVADLGIPLIAGGHCHNLAAERDDHTVILQGGQYYQGYAYVTLEWDADTGEYKTGKYGSAPNLNGSPDPYLAALVQFWELKWEAEKQRVIAYLGDALPGKSDQLGRLVGLAWLEAMPEADLAILARGLLHESLPSGEVTVGDITDLLSPRHMVIEVELTGEQVRQVLSHGEDPVVTGMQQVNDTWVLDQDGEPLDSDQVYRVLVDSSMYTGEYGYGLIGEFNPQGANTGIDGRTPVIEWLEKQNSTPDHPLELLPELSEG